MSLYFAFFLFLLFLSCGTLLLSCILLVQGFLQAHSLAHVEALDLILDELRFEIYVQEKARLGGITLASLSQLDAFNDVIVGLDVLDYCVCHRLAALKPE